VPAAWEAYLKQRYGDWRTPVQGWSYWTQDGTFVQSPPEAVVITRSPPRRGDGWQERAR
jgi:hypothetical protein